MQVLVTGAKQGPTGKGILALALILDLDTGEIVHRTEYMTPGDIRVPEQKVQFTGHCFIDGRWFVCTHNEVVIYEDWPPTSPAGSISLRGFNDLHHCFPWRHGLGVSNTGLETVDIVTLNGELIERHDLLAEVPEARRIDESIDYRLIPDTKPHVRHANHLFELDGELWTGQLRTQDAVCIRDQSRRMDMQVGMPHDGTLLNGKYVFTTTNGHLVFFEPASPHERTIYNLTEMTPELQQLGWCRGVTSVPGSDDEYLVGFSALRRSSWKEFGYWIKHGHEVPNSRIAKYNLRERRLVETWQLGEHKGYQIFQIDVLPSERCA